MIQDAESVSARRTEWPHPAAEGLDDLPPAGILDHLLVQQQASLSAVRPAFAQIERAARLLADTVRGGGRIAYAGAGSSALMAVADGMELPGTFGLNPDRIVLMMAGGLPRDARMPGDTEDDRAEGARAGGILGAGDTVICVSASGTTAYPLGVAEVARGRGASVIGIANNPKTPLLLTAHVAICLQTPPEVIAGSTRMGAGSAQKCCLNMMSTLMAVFLGEVHDGRMVNLVADNAKLQARAAGMVADIAGCDPAAARAALVAANGSVKVAVLIARGLDAAGAVQRLAAAGGRLRRVLEALPPQAGRA